MTTECPGERVTSTGVNEMAWDATRPVPWRRLMREAAIFLVLGVILFAVVLPKSSASSYIGLVIGMGLFVGFSAVLAKFGYQRQSLRDARRNAPARTARSASSQSSATAVPTLRSRPAPTRRTSTGPSQRPNRKRR